MTYVFIVRKHHHYLRIVFSFEKAFYYNSLDLYFKKILQQFYYFFFDMNKMHYRHRNVVNF